MPRCLQRSAFIFLFLGIVLVAASPVPLPYGIGVEGSVSARLGLLRFENTDLTLKSRPPMLLSLGGFVSRRFDGKKLLRVAPELSFRVGGTVEDTLYDRSLGGGLGGEYASRLRFVDCGFDLPIGIAVKKKLATFWLGAGPGIHLVMVRERFTELGSSVAYTPEEPRQVPLSQNLISPAAVAQIGFDYRLSPTASVTAGYLFRFGQTLQYSDRRDFPLSAPEYKELGFWNALRVGILFGFSP